MCISPCTLSYPFRFKKTAITGDAVSFTGFLPRIMFYFVNRQFFLLSDFFWLVISEPPGKPK